MLLLGSFRIFFLSIVSCSVANPISSTAHPEETTVAEDATKNGLTDCIQEILKMLKGHETGDGMLMERVKYFAAGAATTLGLCLVISFCMVVNGLMWQRCTYVPAHLQQNGRRQSQSNNYQPVPQRPKAPGDYGYGGPGFGGDWGFGDGAQEGTEDDSEVYYSIPFEDYATPADALPERIGAEAKEGNNEEEGTDDIEIEDNDIYNVGGDAPAATDVDGEEIEENDVYNMQSGNDEVQEGSPKRDQAPEESEYTQAERWKNRKESHVQRRVSEIERAAEIERQMSVPEIKRQTSDNAASQELPPPPDDIIHSLAVALKERQEQLEQQKLNQNHSNANNTGEITYADDDEELYTNMDVCRNEQGSQEETQGEVDHQDAATNYMEDSVQNQALYQDDEELYCNTNCGRYDEEPLYGNI